MSKTTWNKFLAASLLVFSTAAIGTTAYAAEGSGDATMTVLTELSVTNDQSVVFGDVNRPSAGDYQFTLQTDDAIDFTANTSDGFHAGGVPTAGEFTISGEASQSVDVDVAFTPFADAGITIGTAYIDIDEVTMAAASTTGTLDAVNGTLKVFIGADVTVSSAALTQAHTTTVTVTANYL